jgi:manganese-dependent inorganic pyrophosphatase
MQRSEQPHPYWVTGTTYVVGHQRPDTDALASALGYAWYLTALGEERVIAARAGAPPPQADFALRRFGVEPPPLLASAAPTFLHAAAPVEPLAPDAPLSAALARVAAGGRALPIVGRDGVPQGVVTAVGLARALSAGGQDALAAPCGSMVEAAPLMGGRERLSDHRTLLLRSEADDFLVTDEVGRYAGIATRAGVLQPPRARLVLVDHNELSQAVAGAEEAEIVAVLDHHRLGNPPTSLPIPFTIDPVGSTCTLVVERCRAAGLKPPGSLAGMMLSGILSDTLLFRSPTTTERDRGAASWLAPRAGVEVEAYGEELLRATPGLSLPADAVLDGDRKRYEMGGRPVSIAQAEVTGLHELPERKAELLEALEQRVRSEGLALACLMVTDVVTGRSRLLGAGEPRILSTLPFPRLADGEWDLDRMVSRKKQLVPALVSTLGSL